MINAGHINWRIRSSLLWYLKARTRFRIHSPSAYRLCTVLLSDNGSVPEFEKIRTHLGHMDRKIDMSKYGAGSKMGMQLPLSVIVRKVAAGKGRCEQLHRLLRLLEPSCLLELGTGTGLSAIYMAKACPEGRLITVEGNPELSRIAAETIKKSGLHGIELKCFEFGRFLESRDHPRYNFVHLDGDHRYRSVVRIFDRLLEICSSEMAILVDDIRWSKEMETAWEEIRRHPGVNLSLDLYDRGLLFLEKRHRDPLHLNIAAVRFKPWELVFAH